MVMGITGYGPGSVGSGTGASTGGFLQDLGAFGTAVGDFLGGTGGQLIGAGLSIDELNKITDIAQRSAAEQAAIGREAQEATAFKPFTVSTGFGGITATPTGGYTTTLSPAMAAQQQALQGITSGLLGGMGGMGLPATAPGPDVGRYYTATSGPVADVKIPLAKQPPVDEQERRNAIQDYLSFYKRDQQPVTLGPKALELQARLAGQPSGGLIGELQPAQAPTSLNPFAGMSPEELKSRLEYERANPEEFRQSIMPVKPQPQPMAPQAPMAPSTGGFGAGIPDVSGIQQQALGGVGGFLTGATAPMAQREADVYERIRATQRPEEQRKQLALEERLAAQGRTGLRTAQFGGSPEQLALAQAQEEAKARASLAALEQAQAEQLQQVALAESMFGLGGRAAALPASLQAGQLGNIGAAMELQYLPEQQLLASLTPAISLADIAGTGQRQGAGLMSEAGISGLEDILQAETVRSQNLRDIYSTILGAQANQQAARTAAAGQAASNTGLLSGIGNIATSFLDIFR